MAYNGDGTRSESLSVTFDSEFLARYWQHNAMRLMRANERILHGFLNAATREMELAQEMMRYNLETLRALPRGEAERPDAAKKFNDFEHIAAGMREVTEGLWKTFGDASRLLLEGSLTEAQEVGAEAARKTQSIAKQVASAAQ